MTRPSDTRPHLEQLCDRDLLTSEEQFLRGALARTILQRARPALCRIGGCDEVVLGQLCERHAEMVPARLHLRLLREAIAETAPPDYSGHLLYLATLSRVRGHAACREGAGCRSWFAAAVEFEAQAVHARERLDAEREATRQRMEADRAARVVALVEARAALGQRPERTLRAWTSSPCYGDRVRTDYAGLHGGCLWAAVWDRRSEGGTCAWVVHTPQGEGEPPRLGRPVPCRSLEEGMARADARLAEVLPGWTLEGVVARALEAL